MDSLYLFYRQFMTHHCRLYLTWVPYMERKQHEHITENPGHVSRIDKEAEGNRRLSDGKSRGRLLHHSGPAEPADSLFRTDSAALLRKNRLFQLPGT